MLDAVASRTEPREGTKGDAVKQAALHREETFRALNLEGSDGHGDDERDRRRPNLDAQNDEQGAPQLGEHGESGAGASGEAERPKLLEDSRGLMEMRQFLQTVDHHHSAGAEAKEQAPCIARVAGE
jgi:hypothetical protein